MNALAFAGTAIDEGPGIRAERRDQIFGPFSHFSSRHGDWGRHGLGLPHQGEGQP
jgi:K+-sensing histidine kinase KdpD